MYTRTNRVLSIPRLQPELKHQGKKCHISTTIQPSQQVKTALELSFPLEQWEHLIIQQTGDKEAAETADVPSWGQEQPSLLQSEIELSRMQKGW